MRTQDQPPPVNDQGLPPNGISESLWLQRHGAERWAGPLTLDATEVLRLVCVSRSGTWTYSRYADQTINRLVGFGFVFGRPDPRTTATGGTRHDWRYDLTPAGRAWLQGCRAVETDK
jgi:hypothetical protein